MSSMRGCIGLALVLGGCVPSFVPCGPTYEAAAPTLVPPLALNVVHDARVNIAFVLEGVRAGALERATERARALFEGTLDPRLGFFARVPGQVAGWVLPLVSATDELRDADTSDTALGGCLNRDASGHGRLAMSTTRVRELVVKAFPTTRVDAVVVLFATPGRPTTHGSVVLAGDDVDVGTLVHELAHALLGLGDEYPEGGACWDGPRPAFTTWPDPFATPNLTLDRGGAKWRDLVEGAEPGGDAAATCIYHPPGACRMKDRRTAAWCPVCDAELWMWAAAIRGNDGPPRCDIALAAEPEAMPAGTTQIDIMAHDYDGVREIALTLDGREVLRTTRGDVEIERTLYGDARVLLAAGRHEIRATCVDAEGKVSNQVVELHSQ